MTDLCLSTFFSRARRSPPPSIACRLSVSFLVPCMYVCVVVMCWCVRCLFCCRVCETVGWYENETATLINRNAQLGWAREEKRRPNGTKKRQNDNNDDDNTDNNNTITSTHATGRIPYTRTWCVDSIRCTAACVLVWSFVLHPSHYSLPSSAAASHARMSDVSRR